MQTRHLLYLDANSMRCFLWDQGRVSAHGQFSATDEGIAGFSRHVQQHAGDLYTLLVDLVEEGFHYETLPFVRGADRDAMIERKRGQVFFGSPLSGALSLGREAGGRRDERILFVALTRHAAVEPWLQALRAANAPLTGIHSPALLFDRLAQRLGVDVSRALVVSLAPGGMRQTFFHDGRLRFSRLSVGLHQSGAQLNAQCSAEILKTHSYLVGQRLISRGTRLPVYMLFDDAEYDAVHPALAAIDELEFRHAPLSALAAKIGLRGRTVGSSALPLMLHWMARESGLLQLAPPAERRYYRVWQARQAIHATGVLVLAGSLLFAGKLWFDAYELKERIDYLQTRAATQNAQLRMLLDARPELPVPLGALQPAMDMLETLRAQTTSPRPWLTHLAAALDAHPDIALLSVNWRLADATAERPAAVLGEARLALPGELADDRRAQIEAAQRFVADLGRAPGRDARMTRMPVDIESDQVFSSSSDAPTTLRRPEFDIEFAWQDAVR